MYNIIVFHMLLLILAENTVEILPLLVMPINKLVRSKQDMARLATLGMNEPMGTSNTLRISLSEWLVDISRT